MLNTSEKQLNLSKDQFERYAGKKYLAVYEVESMTAIDPFTYHRTSNMDDWVIVDDINKIKVES